MEAIKHLYRDFARLPEIRFIIRFLLLFAGLYYAAFFFVGITIKGGLYSPFIIENLNVIKWLKVSILQTANLMTRAYGLDTYVQQSDLRITDGSWVYLGYPCLGLGVFSFWSAFMMAQDMSLKSRIKWLLIGIFAIWLINCVRVAFLLIAIGNKWTAIKNMDHHLTFNIVAYSLILLMMYIFYRKNKETDNAKAKA